MQRKGIAIILSLAIGLVLIGPALAASTTKSLSTNFTLVNLGSAPANGSVQYFLPNGSAWKTADNFTLSASGGQAIYRQYFDTSLTNGQGSVVVSADQPLGAVVQILARGQNPTSSGAYSGFTAGEATFYVPLAARNLNTASGLANSQIVVQNTGSAAANVEIDMVNTDGTTAYTKTGITIQPGASYLYDLADELSANVPDGWYGSARVRTTTTGGQIAAVSNFFTGDALQTFNAFGSSVPGTTWFVPLFTSRLSNSLSTPVTVQNLSGASIAAGGVTLNCSPDPSLGGSSFTLSNPISIGNTGAYTFNPVTDLTIPGNFYGSCVLTASANVVAIVQMRFIATGEAAAYEAIKAGSTHTKVIIPLVAKRLSNGFATFVGIQNLDTTNNAVVDLTYVPSPDCSGCSSVSITGQTISGGGSLFQNHRITSGPGAVTSLPDGWFGSLVVQSTNGRPISGFAQLTFLPSINPALPGGDNFMAHNAFTQP